VSVILSPLEGQGDLFADGRQGVGAFQKADGHVERLIILRAVDEFKPMKRAILDKATNLKEHKLPILFNRLRIGSQ
jgi:hypothetical protein